MHCCGVYYQNSTVNIVRVDNRTAELVIIASNDAKKDVPPYLSIYLNFFLNPRFFSFNV